MRAIFRICGNESQLSLLVQLGREAGYALELQVYVFKFSSFFLNEVPKRSAWFVLNVIT